jgi:multidrug efflux pump subunit AcrB
MNVSTWSIRNPIPAIMLFILLTLLGIFSFRALKVQNFPDIDLPTVIVNAALPGTAPAQLETEVARKIENAVATLTGVKHIYTRIQDGSVTVTVEFKLDKPTQEAVDDVRDAINRVRSDLPGDLRDPVISKLNLAGLPISTYTVASNRLDEEALSWFVDNEVTKAILAVPGVGQVTRVGGATREVRVEIDPSRLISLNATVAEISRQLRQVQQEAPGGRSEVGGAEQTVRTIATVKSAAELGALEITLNDGRRIRLDQVAKIADTVAERRSTALLDGKPVVGFEVTRTKGASETEIDDLLKVAVAKLQAAHPTEKFAEAYNFVDPVREGYEGSMILLLEGAVLAVIVVFLFLRDWRATFVSATALPLSIIPTFIGLQYLGFSINVVTLLSLSLVVGILVDDAIVEIENIVRHLNMGKTPYQAAVEAVDEIGLAVIATTFTLIAVFLPTAFMAGVAGKFFKQFGWTAAIAVFVSLVVARLLTPMMAAYMLKPPKVPQVEKDGPVMRWYMRLATWCLKHRWLTSLGAFLFFVGSVMLVPLLPTGFIPPDDFSTTQVQIELPPGSTFKQTLEASERARGILTKIEHVTQVYSAIGGGTVGADPFAPAGASEARKANLTLTLTPREKRSSSKQQIEAKIREAMGALPGARVAVGLGGSGEQLKLALTGDDPVLLTATALQLEREIRTVPGLGNVASSASLIRQELVITPDAARAADLGVTTAAIADTLRIATSGDYDQALAKLNFSQRQVPIVVRLPAASRGDISLLERLPVPGKQGNVMLGSVASIRIDSGPAQIDRYDRSRNVNFDIELGTRQLGEVSSAIDDLPIIKALPPGIKRVELGDVEGMKELFESFLLAMGTGVLCIFIVLVLLFKDFIQPITILAALPLSLGGAFGALLLAQKALSMPAMIGLIMLMGIATKNSILLVEYAIVARNTRGMNRTEALLDACHKRARPIVMTTIAMGAGMLPIAIGFGTDPSFRSPMAVAVIGGLITSTFLSLLVIPVVYTFVDDFEHFFQRKAQRNTSTIRSDSAKT